MTTVQPMTNVTLSILPTMTIDGVSYHNSKDMLTLNPGFFKGVTTTPRRIIDRKKIPATDYVYATLEKGKGWNLSTDKCKKAQLLISTTWINANRFFGMPVKTPEVSANEATNEVTNEATNEVTNEANEAIEAMNAKDAPPIIHLNDAEKFHDYDGRVIEIETRGERDEDKIYFKVKDVSIGFEMPGLNHTLVTSEGYKRGIHYTTFKREIISSRDGSKPYKTTLYLTHEGFLKVIAINRSQFFNHNGKTIHRWLKMVSNEKQNGHEYESFTLNNVYHNTTGFIYVCTSDMFDGVKIGRTINEKGLKSRYKMAYGDDLILHFKKVDNMYQAETQIHDNFKKFNISGELFKKEHIDLYIDYLHTEQFNSIQNDASSPNFHTLENMQENIITQKSQEQESAPPIIHLNDAEKFHDSDGHVIEIETRGERDRRNVYFKVKDVSIGFEMPRLNDTLTNKESWYECGVHYTTFKRESRHISNVSKHTNKPYKTTLYLTYKGLLRVLFVSRSKHVDKFQDWAEEKLFTIQMGSKEQKVKLGTDLCNIPLKTYKAIFESHTSNFPSIYLLALGKVRDLRATFGISDTIPDDSVVYKYGFTRDFARRIGEHQQAYSKLPGVTVDVKWFQNIDIKYLSDAENEVEEECSAYGTRLHVPEYKELIVLNDRQFEHMQKSYRRIGKEYAGATAELNEKIEELRAQIKDMQMQHRHALLEKDFIIQRVTMQHERDTMMFALKEDNYKLQLQVCNKSSQ